MIIQRPHGFFVVIKPPGKAHVVLGGPYDRELALIRDTKLVEEYIKKQKAK